MKKINNILDIFQSDDLKQKVNELVVIINDLSTKLPTIAISRIAIANADFYNGMSYQEFAEWIDDQSKETAEMLIAKKGFCSSELFQEQANAIIRLFDVIIVLWWKCYPDLATECCIQTERGETSSMAGLVFKAIERNLKSIGYMPKGINPYEL